MKDIKGFEGVYAVTEGGEIWSYPRNGTGGHNGIFMKQNLHTHGYLQVCLKTKGTASTRYAHRLVAETYLPNPYKKSEVNHKNGIKTDNRVENLEWSSSGENKQHAYDTGLRFGGEGHNLSKLKAEEVIEIRNLYSNGQTDRGVLAKTFNVSPTLIWQIVRRKIWKQLN